MIDFHNHILPNTDDGSKSLEMSIDMLIEAERQGITDVVNTVHYQHPKMDGKNTNFEYIKSKLEDLQNKVYNIEIDIKLHMGSEVFFLPNLLKISRDPITTMGNGKYMLIEFPLLQFPPNYEKELFDLHLSGITPIIAHPERYRPIQNNVSMMESFFDKGYIIQLDAGSILGHFGANVQKCVNDIINHGWFHLIGSDAHNNLKRNFCLKQVIDLKSKIIINNKNIIFKDNPQNLINGKKLFELEVEQEYNKYSKILHKMNRILNFKK